MTEQPAIGPAPTTSQHLPILDVWRGAAIAFLLVGHFLPIPKLNCGRLEVEFFFVLSGFLMGRLLFVKKTPLGRFYRRRISRIFPTAYAFLGTLLAIGLWSSSTMSMKWPGVFSCFLFFMNYFVALGPAGVSIGLPADHFWSLCVEEHTYIYLSILAVIQRRTGGSAIKLLVGSLLVCVATSAVVGVAEHWNYYRVYWRSDCRAGSILFGAIVSILEVRGVGGQPIYRGIRGDLLGTSLVLAGILLNFNKIPDFVKYTVGTASLAVGLLLVSRHGSGVHRSMRPVAWLGTISFSIYLWQQPFYHAMNEKRLGAGQALGLALLTGIASYFLLERPARDRLNAYWAR